MAPKLNYDWKQCAHSPLYATKCRREIVAHHGRVAPDCTRKLLLAWLTKAIKARALKPLKHHFQRWTPHPHQLSKRWSGLAQ